MKKMELEVVLCMCKNDEKNVLNDHPLLLYLAVQKQWVRNLVHPHCFHLN